MPFRGLLVAVVLLLGLGVGLYFSNKQKAAEAAKPPTDAPPKILALTEGDITKIALKKRGAEETDLEKTNGKWQITAPKPYPADVDAASQLASSVSMSAAIEWSKTKPPIWRPTASPRRASKWTSPAKAARSASS